jgi:hypothetical protein
LRRSFQSSFVQILNGITILYAVRKDGKILRNKNVSGGPLPPEQKAMISGLDSMALFKISQRLVLARSLATTEFFMALQDLDNEHVGCR